MDMNDSFKSLTEKLSAALVNVGAKEDLVKQHAKVAEEAVAGWEKTENEAATLRQQLEAAVQQNLALEVKTNHLDAALKECAKQLRISKEEQEQRTNENLENLEKENLTLKFELNLSTLAAETASKQQLESVKKVAKLEAECRRLQSLTRKSNDNHKAVSVSSFYVDSLTDSQSVDSFKVNNLDHNEVEAEQGCSDSWARALMAELDRFNSGKCAAKNVISCSEINNMMDDFLEMERIASLSDGQIEMFHCNSETEDNSMKTELEVMSQRIYELENALNTTKESLAFSNAQLTDTKSQMVDLQKELTEVNMSKELLESQLADTKSQMIDLQMELTEVNRSKKLLESQLADSKSQMVDLQKELSEVNRSKELLDSRLARMETEAQIMSMEVDSIKADIEKERRFSYEMKLKCEGLEKELVGKTEEIRVQQAVNSNVELKVKKGLEVAAADKLSECQKTISSLARQLESLVTIEDIFIDTANLPGLSGSFVPKTGGELWKLHSNGTFMPKSILMSAKQGEKNCGLALNGDDDDSPSSSLSSTVLLNQFGGRFEKLFNSRNGIEGDSVQ
ncbi:filament-like plant protein [Bidens hawaiensis]|uniref:filament-like plant protein n=1 Tax=Bidens hawaiensis TaxID=980011 RepID=UPI004048EF47